MPWLLGTSYDERSSIALVSRLQTRLSMVSYRRFMIVVLIVTICPQSIFFIVVTVSRNPGDSPNILQMLNIWSFPDFVEGTG